MQALLPLLVLMRHWLIERGAKNIVVAHACANGAHDGSGSLRGAKIIVVYSGVTTVNKMVRILCASVLSI